MNQHQLVLCDRFGLDPRNAKRRFCDQLLFRFGFEQCGWLFGFESVGGLSIAIPVCTDCEHSRLICQGQLRAYDTLEVPFAASRLIEAHYAVAIK